MDFTSAINSTFPPSAGAILYGCRTKGKALHYEKVYESCIQAAEGVACGRGRVVGALEGWN